MNAPAPETPAAAPALKIRSGRDALQFAEASVLRAIVAAFGLLPIDLASALGGAVGRLIGPHTAVSRRAAARLRRALPASDAAENRRIIAAMWDNFGRAVAEYAHLPSICAAGSGRVEIVNGASLVAFAAAGRPVILFGGHFANWEVGPSVVHRLMGAALMSVYRAPNNPWAEQWHRRLLPERLAVPKGSEGGRQLLRHLRHGGSCAMLVDQKLNDGIAVPFFGRPAMTAPAVARLALRFGCPILPVRVERVAGARFRVTILPALDVGATGDSDADALAIMTRVNAQIEDWVRLRPEQWLWLHRRWPD